MNASSVHRSRVIGLGFVLALVASLLAVGMSTAPAEARGNDGHPNAHHGDIAERGTTAGWFDGRDVTFSYSKDFFCRQPPASGAVTGCVLAEEPQTAPRPADIPVAYVLVPLFDDVEGIDLHCPDAGDCINHPSTMDLSAVFGPGAVNATLPPHSHVIDEKRGGWWEVEVNGVTSREAWDNIEAAKDLASVRVEQAKGDVTPDIPTNLYLWFNTQG